MTDQSIHPQKQHRSRRRFAARPLKLWHDQGSDIDVRIEIVPLIDVIFCILTFFILGAVGLSRQQAISLNLPKAASGTPQMREMLVVSLDDFGQVYVEKQPVTPNQLTDAIKNYHQNNPNGIMVLHASRSVSYNEVIQVLDSLRQVGGDRVALATLPGETKSSDNWSYPTTNPYPSGLPNNYSTPGSPTYPNNPTSGLGQYPSGSTMPAVPGSTSPQPNGLGVPTPPTGFSQGNNRRSQ